MTIFKEREFELLRNRKGFETCVAIKDTGQKTMETLKEILKIDIMGNSE